MSPGEGREVLSLADRSFEDLLLRVRLREGYPLSGLGAGGPAEADRLVADGLLSAAARAEGRVVLTREGRMLADLVVRRLADAL